MSSNKSTMSERILFTLGKQNLQQFYKDDKTVLLFAYSDEIIGTEAYADWAAYLNDFKLLNSDVYFYRIASNALVTINSTLSPQEEYSIFIKQGMPTYIYEGLILEPQVYEAVQQVYAKKTLTEEHKAFLPEKIN